MATPYDTIYDRAMFRFRDYDLLAIDPLQRNEILQRYLRAAEADFGEVCRYDLEDRDDDAGEYTEDLDNETIEVLACGVAYYWMSAHAMNSELFHNKLSTKDYTSFSPANLLREINVMRESLGKEFNRQIVKYSYTGSDIADRKA